MSFHQRVLDKICEIPAGKVATYKAVAHALHSKAYRAVGTALRNNQHPIVVPCHRVVNSNGYVGSYAGKKDGCRKKAQLLAKEGVSLQGLKVQNLKKYTHFFTA